MNIAAKLTNLGYDTDLINRLKKNGIDLTKAYLLDDIKNAVQEDFNDITADDNLEVALDALEDYLED